MDLAMHTRKAYVRKWAPPPMLTNCSFCEGWMAMTATSDLKFHSNSGSFALVTMEHQPYVPSRTVDALASNPHPIPIDHIHSNAIALSRLSPTVRSQVIAHDLVKYRVSPIVKRHGHITKVLKYTTNTIIFQYEYASESTHTQALPRCCHPSLLKIPFELCQLSWKDRLMATISAWSCFSAVDDDEMINDEQNSEWTVRAITV
ncbi:hypothetical protein BKA70DRAFT_1233744 [Coprinopsis sp. MPI-PUGE-AT-0042]|nr:hypothetical protein BKA70DRAFT_1233744 [Coprinopsis sp. MPI-PUGE-AT-0042]